VATPGGLGSWREVSAMNSAKKTAVILGNWTSWQSSLLTWFSSSSGEWWLMTKLENLRPSGLALNIYSWCRIMGEGFQMALNIISNDPFYWSRKEKMLAGLNSLSLETPEGCRTLSPSSFSAPAACRHAQERNG
jgi:hypothetical protein